MKKLIKAATKSINYRRIRLAVDKMEDLLDILDGMDEATYGAFEDNAAGDIYTMLSDSVMSIKNGAFDDHKIQ